MSDCYIAIKPCGCAVAAVVIVPEHAKDVAKTVASWVRDGLRIETRSVEWVRANLHGCRCQKEHKTKDDAPQLDFDAMREGK